MAGPGVGRRAQHRGQPDHGLRRPAAGWGPERRQSGGEIGGKDQEILAESTRGAGDPAVSRRPVEAAHLLAERTGEGEDGERPGARRLFPVARGREPALVDGEQEAGRDDPSLRPAGGLGPQPGALGRHRHFAEDAFEQRRGDEEDECPHHPAEASGEESHEAQDDRREERMAVPGELALDPAVEVVERSGQALGRRLAGGAGARRARGRGLKPVHRTVPGSSGRILAERDDPRRDATRAPPNRSRVEP